MTENIDTFNFPTTILTSKPPDQSALIIPNAINASNHLISKDLVSFFNHYCTVLLNYNQALKQLVGDATKISKQCGKGFGNFPNNLNCLISSLQIEVQSNESIHRQVRSDIINPLQDLIEKDVRISELLINGQELQEISDNLKQNKRDAEMQWNYKAPQSFQNLENFKKIETQLLFDIILNFFQIHNGKATKVLKNNENSTNYLLGSFKLDTEMSNQLKYLVNTEFNPTAKQGFVNDQIQQQTELDRNTGNKPGSLKKQATGASESSSKHATPVKKQSKLKSRVGSIFGRRKKKDKHNPMESSIPENASLSTTASSVRASTTRSDLGASEQNRSSSKQHLPPIPSSPQKKDQPELPPKLPHANNDIIAVTPERQPSTSELPSANIQQKAAPALIDDSPNVVKYENTDEEASSDEEGPEPTTGVGRRRSLLERHELNTQPDQRGATTYSPIRVAVPVEISHGTGALNRMSTDSEARLSIPRSRQSSSGKYSFEAGDDQKPISTPRIESSGFDELTPVEKEEEEEEEEEQIQAKNGNYNAGPVVPPPPPSRKVAQQKDQVAPLPDASRQQHVARRDVHSQMFHNLPPARESFIAPASTGGSFKPLSSQNTGHSVLKNTDLFKHHNLNNEFENIGLNASVAEVINARFKDGKLVKSQVMGEVAFNYHQSNPSDLAPSEPILIKIPQNYEKISLNKSFMEQLNDNTYKLIPSYIISKTLGGMKYLAILDDNQVPIVIQQIWKYEPHQSSLMVSIRLNPEWKSRVILENFVVSVALNTDIEATSASSKPQGAFNKEKNRITWRYNDALILDPSKGITEEKLIARFITNGLGSEHESGVQIKFEMNDCDSHFISILDNDDPTREYPTFRNLVSGSYSSHF
ncbi:SYP1 [[Candida] subhashii]|uniref:SYP1 n=1 Tax=[Candida] subhashii TaxID=561895 RepID=A0A8J5QQJ1_9ASCO|nr:SYP1 [[Candida] subhashii]KAG7665574.1 SYP1 [[Candida] subhashii]